LFGDERREFFSRGLGFHWCDNLEWMGIDDESSNRHEMSIAFLNGRIIFVLLVCGGGLEIKYAPSLNN
jgi:hypothetical protein